MELVYLWVEDYKNIHKQGFNFSPRFECAYDEETQELIVFDKNKNECENNDYIENFFGEDINITAIVGENGSGKSAILSSLPMNSEPLSYENNILVCYIDNTIQIYTKKDLETIYTLHKEILFDFEYISSNNDYLVSSFIDDYSAYFFTPKDLNNNLLSDIYVKSNFYIDLQLYTVIVNKLIYKYSSINNLFNYQPDRLVLSIRFGNIKNLFKDLKLHLEKETLSDTEISNSSTNIYDLLNYHIESDSFIDKFIIYIFLLMYEKDKKCVSIIETLYFNIDIEIIDLKKPLFEYIEDNFSELLYLSEYFDFFTLFFQETENFEKKINIQTLKNKYSDKLDFIFQKPEIQKLLKIEFYDTNDTEFKKLSHGERQIIVTSLAIYDKVQQTNKKNILILLDEPDLSLHPEWQKKYLHRLIQNLSQFNKKIHLILTSHSPFILSDLAKENVIFLKNGKEDKTVNINPFGANIHTLLSNGFFMQDGLMGEFAKNKIDEVIKYLKLDATSKIQTDKEAKSIIDIIGEPVLKSTFQTMYDDKVYTGESKLDTLKRKQKELEEAIKQEESNEKS